ncbi:hypothetical protein SJI19_04255 [Acerihabitans sp. TG2]|uniref:hypothetical protein n=1 Tax=Acerihabitans sp. TG2 TaxID=3096008 RepID=UPI002B235C22|nr:hypothetical protein [Acerihabitans sp. TG2]MEA9389774.1 hypothetical protein [Acerihabitans sp. TG2]
MNWSVPPLIDSPSPSAPGILRWSIGLLVMLVAGFFLAVYLLSPEELRNKKHLMLVAFAAPLLIWSLIFGGRLVGYGVQSARVNARNQVVALRRVQWQRWANQTLNLLAWSRQTALGPQDHALMVSEQSPVNQGNRLVISEFADLPAWESRTLLIARVLHPISAFGQAHPLTQPLTLLWQVPPAAANEADWGQLLTQEAQRQSLSFTAIAPFASHDFSQWLLTAYDQPLNGLLCLVFIDVSDRSPASEEAVSLLIAADDLCRQANITPKAQLLRPLLTPASTLPQAMTQLCAQQCAPADLSAGWQRAQSDIVRDNIPVACAELNMRFRATQRFDIDNALGLSGIARHATQVTLAAEHHGNNLLFTEHQGQCLVQQLRHPPGASQ